MKKRLLNLYIIFVIILFIFSLGVFGFNVFSEYSHGENRCNRRFEHLTATLKQDYSNNSNGFNSENLLKAVGSLEDFSYIVIKADNTVVYSYPDANISIENQSTKLVKAYFKTINTTSGNFSVNAGIYTLRPTEIGKYAKISFLIILIVTIITILIIIVLSATEKNDFDKSKKDDLLDIDEEKTVDQVLAENPLNFTVNPIPTPNDEIYEKEPLSQDAEKLVIEEKSVDNESKDDKQITDSYSIKNIEIKTIVEKSENNLIESDFPLENNNESEKNDETTVEIEEKPIAVLPVDEIKPMELENENPKGLFSPITGIGWESYMLTRLENELNRAISSEIDLALFVIKLPGIQRDFAVMKDICDYLIVQFQFKDLIFEYKDDSIVAIKISSNIDDALTLAERINEDINNMLIDYPSKCFIGISTRTIRMMSAERLLKEADEALVHAQEDEDSPIIAFRADAIKYQKFLETSF